MGEQQLGARNNTLWDTGHSFYLTRRKIGALERPEDGVTKTTLETCDFFDSHVRKNRASDSVHLLIWHHATSATDIKAHARQVYVFVKLCESLGS